MLHPRLSTVPSSLISAAAAATFSSLLEAMTTLAPRLRSSSVIALPIPVPPPEQSGEMREARPGWFPQDSPVTIATFPANRPGRNTDIFGANYLDLKGRNIGLKNVVFGVKQLIVRIMEYSTD